MSDPLGLLLQAARTSPVLREAAVKVEALVREQQKRIQELTETKIICRHYEALERVRELHKPESGCNHVGCSPFCSYCDSEDYPCPTIRAIEGEAE